MKKKLLLLLSLPLFLFSCNGGKVNTPKSPFNDSYKRIGCKSKYENITLSDINPSEYESLKKSIKDYKDNDNGIKQYKRVEETRDLKAAYFGQNLGAANLCSLTSRTDVNSRYDNNVTTKFVTNHKENQFSNGNIIKSNQQMDDYIYSPEENKYFTNRLLKNDNENPVVTKSEPKEFTETIKDDVFGVQAYEKDIKNNFANIKSRKSGESISFSVLADTNNAVYGKTKINNIGDRFIIREALSDFATYSTSVGDTYKCVDNYFYEALLDNEYRFTNFRFYHELLILSEALNDETKVPVLYLEKPELVEFSEIEYEISYNSIGDFTGEIPQP